jgi:hypothetical protein
MDNKFLHGCTPREGQRLHQRALTPTKLLHFDILCPSGHKVLEAGCGARPQMKIPATHRSCARFVWRTSLKNPVARQGTWPRPRA